MPAIKTSTDLRNHYNEISAMCHSGQEPVFIAKNGQGDLAVMSIEMYERLTGRLELYACFRKDCAMWLTGIHDLSARQWTSSLKSTRHELPDSRQ